MPTDDAPRTTAPTDAAPSFLRRPQWWPIWGFAWAMALAVAGAIALAAARRVSDPALLVPLTAGCFGVGILVYGLLLVIAPDDGPGSPRRRLAAITTAVTVVVATLALAWVVLPDIGADLLGASIVLALGWGAVLLVVAVAANGASKRRRRGDARD